MNGQMDIPEHDLFVCLLINVDQNAPEQAEFLQAENFFHPHYWRLVFRMLGRIIPPGVFHEG